MPINRELSQFGSFVEVANSTKLGIVDPNVGIGTTNPTVKVEVHGDIKVVDGNIDANGNLDVDGYSDLDELNVTGIATFTNGIQCSGSAMNVTAGFVANTARVSDLTDNRVVIAGNSGELEDNSNFTFDGSTLSVGADFTLTGIDTGSSAGPEFKLYRNSSSPDDGDYLGQIKFAGESDTGVERNYAKITGKILDASNGTEDGILEFAHIKAGSQNISARFRSDSLQLLNGTNFSVAGDSTLTGDLDVDGHTDLDFVAVSAAATFSSLVDVNGGLEANTAKIGDLTDNRVVIAGVGGELEDNSKFTFNDETVNINAQLTVSGVSTFSGGLSMGSGSIGLTTNSITGPAEMFIDPAAVGDNTGVVRIKGDLYVDGTTTQINSETLTIADFVVGIASTATTDSLADGAGINIGPDNTFKYDHTNTSLKSSENLNVASGKTYKINGTDVLSATTLGSAVVNSSLTSVGTLSALTVSGDVSIADKIIHTGDTNTAIRFPAADTFTVETAGSERLRITSAGLVGIGTDNPSKSLSILSSQSVMLQLESTSTTARIGFKVPNTSDSPTIGVSDEEDLQIRTGGSERLRITSGGNVGIGTDTPNLQSTSANNLVIADFGGEGGITIKSNINSAGNIFFADTAATANGRIAYGHGTLDAGDYMRFYVANEEKLRINANGNIGIGTNSPDGKLDVRGTIFVNGDATGGRIFASGGSLSLTDGNGRQTLRIDDPGSGNTHTHVFDSNGRLGIGLTNPTAKLEVATSVDGEATLATFKNTSGGGTNETVDIKLGLQNIIASNVILRAGKEANHSSGAATDNFFAIHTTLDATSSEKLRISSDGKISQGGHTPSYEYDLRGTGQQTILVGSENAGGAALILDGDSNGDGSGTDYASILHSSDGNIEINNRKSADIIFKNTSSEIERLRITSAGNIGVNKTTPKEWYSTYKTLQIYDAGYIAGSSDDSFVAIGANNYLDTGGTYDYTNTDHASQLYQVDGQLVFRNAPSGTADTAITWAERFKVTSAGLVGINTTPGTLLELKGESSKEATVTFNRSPVQTTNGGVIGEFLFENATDSVAQISVKRESAVDDAYIQFATQAAGGGLTERLRISSAGLVGIGTANPVGSLEVRDSKANLIVAKDGLTVKSNSDLHTSYDTLQIGAGGALLSYSTATVTADTQFVHNAYRSSGGTFKYRYADTAARIRMNSPGGEIIFDNAASGSADADITFSERLRITSDGSVGIGLTNPARKVEIFDTAATVLQLNSTNSGGTSLRIQNSGTDKMYMGLAGDFITGQANNVTDSAIRASGALLFASGGGTERLRVTSAGLVGIKNTSPNNTLTVGDGVQTSYAPSTAGNYLEIARTSGGDAGLLINKNTGQWLVGIDNSDGANAPLRFEYGAAGSAHPGFGAGTLGMIIKHDGKVGINSATPAVQLHINSTDAIRVPVGTTGERPTGAAGYIRYNSSIASYEGHNGSEWAGIGGAAEVETAVSSTSATTCESFAKASYRSASIVAQITQGSSYQVGNYLLIHDGTTATLVEESAVATGDMLGTFTATISGSNVVFQVNMNSASSATVTSKMTKVSIP